MINARLHLRERRRGWVDFVPAAMLALVGFCAISWMTLAGGDQSGEQVVVIFPPGTAAERTAAAVADADGLIVHSGGWSGVIVAQGQTPDFAHRIRALGALAVVRVPVPGGCAGVKAPRYS